MNGYNRDEDGWWLTAIEFVTCLVMIPYIIIKHLWHLWCVLLSTGAVLLTQVLNVVLGTEFTQYVDYKYLDPLDSRYDEVPGWYFYIIVDVNNYISTFHMWLVDCLDPTDGDDGNDDDDWEGGEPQEIDEHEELKQPV